ncbi:HipA domain-containing protein [uncultured Parabacteroides sp.]|uniref:type II toxin-antitoxin system HipA family toxin n=1 Tax=uncultured Parabacteroides sp. TaxID=512312 RepID=UPI002589CCC5|nr:HipA domain-containing protein [uncultured Parabacteroides sp.]
MIKIEVCPGNLTPGFDKYSPACLRKLFDGKTVSPVLDFSYDADCIDLIDKINQISVSGVQEKLSAIVENGKITLAPTGQSGRYIIKPAPNYKHLRFRDQIPANEHLTMQIAKQVYKINTAENGLVFFANGEMAYITKRFDFDTNGNKVKQEDFSSLAQKTVQTHGKDFKYTGSYEDAAALLKANVSAWQVEMSKFFTLIVFNYIFANGDAHLKNFSLQQSANGDYLLSPAYDLMNTSLHVQDEDFALHGGLIPQSEYSDIYRRTGHPCKDDFITFGKRIGVLPKKLNAILDTFSEVSPSIEELIAHSFLDERSKRIYRRSYQERMSRFLRGND